MREAKPPSFCSGRHIIINRTGVVDGLHKQTSLKNIPKELGALTRLIAISCVLQANTIRRSNRLNNKVAYRVAHTQLKMS